MHAKDRLGGDRPCRPAGHWSCRLGDKVAPWREDGGIDTDGFPCASVTASGRLRAPFRVDAAMMTAGPLSSGHLKRGTVQRASKCRGGEGQGEKSACNLIIIDAQKYHGIVAFTAGLRALTLAMGMRGYVTA